MLQKAGEELTQFCSPLPTIIPMQRPMLGSSFDKIRAVHSLGDVTSRVKEDIVNNQRAGADASGKEQDQLQLIVELLQARREETRGLRAYMQQQAAAAAADAACMMEFEAEAGSDPQLLAATVKCAWDGRPGPLFFCYCSGVLWPSMRLWREQRRSWTSAEQIMLWSCRPGMRTSRGCSGRGGSCGGAGAG